MLLLSVRIFLVEASRRDCDADTGTVNDLSILPSAAFNLAMAVGIYIVRWRRKKANLPEPEFKAWHVVIIFNILIQLYLIIMPWYPPAGGQYAGDVSFWYATYAVTGVGMLVNLIFVSTLLLVLTIIVSLLAPSITGFGHSLFPSGGTIACDRNSSVWMTELRATDFGKYLILRSANGMKGTM
jgi:hypothetical protein